MKLVLALVMMIAFVGASYGATIKDIKKISPMSNETQVTRAVYDFAVDGGSVASYEVAQATDDIVIDSISVEGLTALDSTGDAVTVDLGITGAGTQFLTASAQSNFEAGDLAVPAETFVPVKLAKNSKVLVEFKVAAPTAGKFVVVIKSHKFGL